MPMKRNIVALMQNSFHPLVLVSPLISSLALLTAAHHAACVSVDLVCTNWSWSTWTWKHNRWHGYINEMPTQIGLHDNQASFHRPIAAYMVIPKDWIRDAFTESMPIPALVGRTKITGSSNVAASKQ
jgi:hypothetical protein